MGRPLRPRHALRWYLKKSVCKADLHRESEAEIAPNLRACVNTSDRIRLADALGLPLRKNAQDAQVGFRLRSFLPRYPIERASSSQRILNCAARFGPDLEGLPRHLAATSRDRFLLDLPLSLITAIRDSLGYHWAWYYLIRCHCPQRY